MEPYPETCDIDYGNIKCVMVSVHNPRNGGEGRVRVDMQADVQCKHFPPALGPELEDRAVAQARAEGNVSWFKLGMLISKQECSRLVELLQAQVNRDEKPPGGQSQMLAGCTQRRPHLLSATNKWLTGQAAVAHAVRTLRVVRVPQCCCLVPACSRADSGVLTPCNTL